MNEIIEFLKTDIWGLIILGGIGSILGSLIIYFSRKFYFWLAKRFKILQTKYYYYKIIENYSEGYTAGMASTSDIHQTILIGRYILNVVVNSTYLVLVVVIAFWLFSIVPFGLFWIIALLAGTVIVFPLKKIKRNFKLFNWGYEQVYDLNKIKKKAEEHLNKKIVTTKVQNKKN